MREQESKRSMARARGERWRQCETNPLPSIVSQRRNYFVIACLSWFLNTFIVARTTSGICCLPHSLRVQTHPSPTKESEKNTARQQARRFFFFSKQILKSLVLYLTRNFVQLVFSWSTIVNQCASPTVALSCANRIEFKTKQRENNLWRERNEINWIIFEIVVLVCARVEY